MSYELHFDEKVIEFIQTLDSNLRERIFKKLTISKTDPLHYFTRLKGRNDYKLRIGKYRVIADIDFNLMLIEVKYIGLRKNVYTK